MFKLLSVVLLSVSFCYATNCYELQQSQISALNDRMSQMLSSFYTPSPQPPVPSVAAAPTSDYNNPYNIYPYPYPLPQNVMYGPPPVFYPSPPVPSNPATKPSYCNVDPREYNTASNWASYYDNYPQYYDYTRSSPYNPLVPPYQMPPSLYPTPLAPSFPPPPQYITPCPSSTPPAYPSWEYAPNNPEYTTYNYAPPSPIPPYALPLPPPALPAPFPQLYHRHTEGSPPYY